MEPSHSVSTARAQVCLVLQGNNTLENKKQSWPAGAQEFVRRLYKQGIQIAVVGPRSETRLGTKKHLRYFDRHEVVTLKELAKAKSQSLELRVMSRKLRAWTRIRTEVCIVSGQLGVWPQAVPGWTSPGVLTLDALGRWINEFHWIPGRRFLLCGSTNREFLWAIRLLDQGAESCMIVEPEEKVRCWRSLRDRFLSKGGKIYAGHAVAKIQSSAIGVTAVYLKNPHGNLIIDADTVVLSSINQESINEPSEWKRGLFYIQKQSPLGDPQDDEAHWGALADWDELYWRVVRFLKVCEPSEAAGAIDKIRSERRQIWAYRRDRKELIYSGKNLSKASMGFLQSTGSVPATFLTPKPMASLECLEEMPCRICVEACPYGAIEKKSLNSFPKLLTDACIGCGACVAVCPSGAAVMVKEVPDKQMARYYLPDHSRELWKTGEPVQILNRRGEVLGSGRAIAATSYQKGTHRVLEIEAPAYNLWDARGFRRPVKATLADPLIESANNPSLLTIPRGWVNLNGTRRLCPVDVPLTVALWQMGYRRFEDAQFCPDGSCGLCAVVVDGEPALACKSIVKEGATIAFPRKVEEQKVKAEQTLVHDCFCNQVSYEEVTKLREEGVSAELARELTGFGLGTCKGRWCEARCLSAAEPVAQKDDVAEKPLAKLRPKWPGFCCSPWHELWQDDILTPQNPTK